MKAFTRLTNDQGKEIEQEISELAIFANSEEIQELIDFLIYVKKDHSVQHHDNNIEVTHSHFSMWKGESVGKLDLQIWSREDDENK